MMYIEGIRDFLYLQFQNEGPVKFPSYFSMALKQLLKVYPRARLHLLTNVEGEVPGFQVHYRPDMPATHSARFHIFDLMDRPFMHLDQDVVVLKPFTRDQLSGEGPFKYFTFVEANTRMVKTKRGLPDGMCRLYNSGVVWVRRPDNSARMDMDAIKREWFSDWPYPGEWALDDHVISVYCFQKGYWMDNVPDVNRLVYGPWAPHPTAQSLHFIERDKKSLVRFLEASCC